MSGRKGKVIGKTECPVCGQVFVVTSAGCSALYHHLCNEHGFDGNRAYSYVGVCVDNAEFINKYG
jgi:hypothetical protein